MCVHCAKTDSNKNINSCKRDTKNQFFCLQVSVSSELKPTKNKTTIRPRYTK